MSLDLELRISLRSVKARSGSFTTYDPYQQIMLNDTLSIPVADLQAAVQVLEQFQSLARRLTEDPLKSG